MLEHLKPEERFKAVLSYAYRIVGRIALIAAFLLAIGGQLHLAISALAVALWMMWSTQNVFTNLLGNDVELVGRKVDSLAAAGHENPLED